MWLKNASEGKKNRLKMLCNILGLQNEPPLSIRYQLFHRTASAILEAKRFNAKYAVMLVHSFSSEHKWFSDYQNFLSLFNISSKINELVKISNSKDTQIFTGWAIDQK